jgi:hypothetical protein
MLDDLDIRSLHQLYRLRKDNTATWGEGRNNIYSDSYAPSLARLFEERMPQVYNYKGPQGKNNWQDYVNSWENPYQGLLQIDNTKGPNRWNEYMELLRERMNAEFERNRTRRRYGM